ncbi:MAG: alpha/beta fold hydrolase [Xanthobacteraceae bacterium]
MFARSGDADIHYEIVGQGEPLLLVAGLGGAASYWNPNLEAFAKHYSVLLHDHRGTGKSSHSEVAQTVELMTDDLLRVMDAAGIGCAHFVGHSTGGAIGQVLAARAPERVASLVLYATWAELDPQMAMCLELRRRVLRSMGEAEYHRTTPVFLYPPYYVRANWPALEQEIAAAIENTSPATIMDSRISGIMQFDGMQYLDGISCPAMVLVAEDDILTPPYLSDQIVERLSSPVIVKLPRGGHAVSRTEPAGFNEVVLKFLGQHRMQGVAA